MDSRLRGNDKLFSSNDKPFRGIYAVNPIYDVAVHNSPPTGMEK